LHAKSMRDLSTAMTELRPNSRFAKISDRKHLAVLKAMSAASLQVLSASDWLRLARLKRYESLRAALKAASINLSSKRPDRALGHYFAAIRDREFIDRNAENDDDYGPWILRGRYYVGDASWRHGVEWPGRAKVLAAKERRKQREESNLATARVIAKQLRRGELDPDALAALTGAARVPAETIAERSIREAAEASRNTYWTPPPTPVRKPEPPPVPIAAPVPIEPEPIVDMSDWPPAWRKHGKPNYSTYVREIPDDSFRNSGPAAPSDAERGEPSRGEKYPHSEYPR
jgi:hypothetical protein